MERQTFSPCPYCDGRNNNCADCEVQTFRASGLTPDDLPRAAELVKAEKEGRCVVLPCRVEDAVDRLFSHNEIIALWYEKPDDRDHSHLLWRGMAWAVPKEYQGQRILKFEGILPECFSEADTINLLVTPYVTPCAEAEAALAENAPAE